MKDTFARKNSRAYKLLKCLALGGGALVLGALSPVGGAKTINAAIRGYIRRKKFAKHIFLRDLKRLQERRLVDFQELDDGSIKITLAKRGRERIVQFKLDDIRLQTSKPWDGKWRLVIFDIPHNKKNARDALRQKIKQLNFYPLQKSVFITPYPCEDEIDFIASIFDVRDHVLILYISKFEGEEKLRHHFKI